MQTHDEAIPFPLFHGTSSYYLSAFPPGHAPSIWPHRDIALRLLRDAWDALQAIGQSPCWYICNVLNQTNGHSNWQHGEIYLTPNELSAVRYAGGGAEYGGELLTLCRNAVDELARFDQNAALKLLSDVPSVAELLQGSGRPILVEFGDVHIADLSPERSSDTVPDLLSRLTNTEDQKLRQIMSQQMNFRLENGRGKVERVYELNIDDIANPLTKYQRREIIPTVAAAAVAHVRPLVTLSAINLLRASESEISTDQP